MLSEYYYLAIELFGKPDDLRISVLSVEKEVAARLPLLLPALHRAYKSEGLPPGAIDILTEHDEISIRFTNDKTLILMLNRAAPRPEDFDELLRGLISDRNETEAILFDIDRRLYAEFFLSVSTAQSIQRSYTQSLQAKR